MKHARRGRPATPTPMRHTAVVLSPDMRDQLIEAAQKEKRSLSEEIRHRLAASLKQWPTLRVEVEYRYANIEEGSE